MTSFELFLFNLRYYLLLVLTAAVLVMGLAMISGYHSLFSLFQHKEIAYMSLISVVVSGGYLIIKKLSKERKTTKRNTQLAAKQYHLRTKYDLGGGLNASSISFFIIGLSAIGLLGYGVHWAMTAAICLLFLGAGLASSFRHKDIGVAHSVDQLIVEAFKTRSFPWKSVRKLNITRSAIEIYMQRKTPFLIPLYPPHTDDDEAELIRLIKTLQLHSQANEIEYIDFFPDNGQQKSLNN
ncbi:hypothetical protein N8482_03225 [Chitinophagales bacterium]|nr:hypothetical protein [Chitinophagales bacterium]